MFPLYGINQSRSLTSSDSIAHRSKPRLRLRSGTRQSPQQDQNESQNKNIDVNQANDRPDHIVPQAEAWGLL